MTGTRRTERSRRMRAESADAERKLWAALRNRQAAGAKFRRQVPIGPYFADFACIEAKLIVEADGGQHAERAAEDAERTAALERMGWRVLRFRNHDVLSETEGVIETILAELKAARP